ncbi:uncharacterized protein JCM6883_001315 [Sporobolomyces salmoneus]|uniref:uncharacterized protein n=1 Tax=Sporobolomyces salmoneus TaxID=183962 RepID=UPI0031799CE5
MSSHLKDLPFTSSTLLNQRSTSSNCPSNNTNTPYASTSLLPFPSRPNSTSPSLSNSSAPNSPLNDQMLLSNLNPTWPNPASYSFSQASKKPPSPSSTVKQRKSAAGGRGAGGGGNLICFELSLGDRLAARLDGETTTTLQSIKEASGVISAELLKGTEGTNGEPGPQKLVSHGSASAVQKARQLLDAKLSQTPIKTVVGIKLNSPSSSSLTFIPSTGPHITRFQPLSSSTYRLVTSSHPPTTHEAQSLPSSASHRPKLQGSSYPSTSSVISEFNLPPTHSQTPQSQTPILLTPSSEPENDDSFFASSSTRTSPTKSLTPSQSSLSPDQASSTGMLPQIGDFGKHRKEFIKSMVDELEFAVKRRSLVRVKLDLGSQEWRREGGTGVMGDFGKERWGIEEIENWRTDTSTSSTSTPSPVSPTFSTSLSSSTAQRFLSLLNNDSTPPNERFEKKNEISQVHILHLDKSRASFGNAISECRGQELRDLPKGCSASGTLVLKKCSTLPAKPFALSIVSPSGTLENGGQQDGTDLRIKILADKAATSPSLDLSAAMQSATWEVDDQGIFRVKIELKEERFGETEILWTARERYENSDESLRLTVSENRYSDSSKHDYSIELSCPKLNQCLANYALDQAQGKKGIWEREKVGVWMEKLIEFGEKFNRVQAAGE